MSNQIEYFRSFLFSQYHYSFSKCRTRKCGKFECLFEKVIFGISLIQQAHDKCTTKILHRIIFHLFL